MNTDEEFVAMMLVEEARHAAAEEARRARIAAEIEADPYCHCGKLKTEPRPQCAWHEARLVEGGVPQ